MIKGNHRFSQDIYRSIQITLQSPIKRKIVDVLYDNGELCFTDLYRLVGLNREESGKFSYHMRYMKHSKLIKFIPNRKTYAITSLGLDFIEFLQRIHDRETGASTLDIYGHLKKSPHEAIQYITLLKKFVSFIDVEFPDLIKKEKMEIAKELS